MVNKPLRPYFWGGYVRGGYVDQPWKWRANEQQGGGWTPTRIRIPINQSGFHKLHVSQGFVFFSTAQRSQIFPFKIHPNFNPVAPGSGQEDASWGGGRYLESICQRGSHIPGRSGIDRKRWRFFGCPVKTVGDSRDSIKTAVFSWEVAHIHKPKRCGSHL